MPLGAAARLDTYAKVLVHLAADLGQARETERALLRALAKIVRTLGFRTAALYLLADDGESLRPIAADGVDRDSLKGTAVRIGSHVTGRAVQQARPAALYNPNGFSADDDPLAAGCSAILAVPLLVGGEVIGALACTLAEGSFGDEEGTALLPIGVVLAQYIHTTRSRRQIQRLRDQWVGLFDALPIGAAVFGSDGMIRQWNYPIGTLLGISPAEAQRASLWEILPPELSQLARYLLGRAVRKGAPDERTLELEGEGLGSRRLHMILVPLGAMESTKEAHGPNMLLLREAHNDARVSNEVLSRERQFMSLVQHELRTPLTSIKGAMHLLNEADQASPLGEHRSLLQIVDKNSMRLQNLIADIIDVVTISNGELTLMPGEIDLTDPVQAALIDLQPSAEKQHIEVVAELPPQPLLVWGDRTRLEQAVRHVLDNAIKFSNPGTRVKCRVGLEEGQGVVEVIDQGPGIPVPFLPKIFEKFTQHSPHLTRSRGGNGVGLYIARAIVELHGGKIAVARTSAQGTTIRIELPPLSAESRKSGGQGQQTAADDNPASE